MIAQAYVASAWFRFSTVKEIFRKKQGYFFPVHGIATLSWCSAASCFVSLQRNQPQRRYNFFRESVALTRVARERKPL